MTNLFIGWKQGVGPVLKVLKYDYDDPLTIANNAYDRFYFNSEVSNLSYAYSFFQTLYLNKTNYPDGDRIISNDSTWVMSSQVGSFDTNTYLIYGCIGRMQNLSNTIPFADCKFVANNGMTTAMRSVKPSTTGSYYQGVTNTSVTSYVDSNAGGFGYSFINSGFGYAGWAIRPTNQSAGHVAYVANDQESINSMIWDLPCNNVPIINPIGTPSEGQLVFEASSSRIKLARPGFDINSASGRQLILDSDRTPIKVVMMGDVFVGANTNVFVSKPSNIEFDLSPSMICDTICNLNGWGYSIPPVNLNTGLSSEVTTLRYIVEPGGVRFYADGSHPVNVRYMLYATGIQPFTSGGVDIIRRVADSHMQIKRPGSSDSSPSYNDILLDTRMSSLSIIAEGYIPASSFTSSQSVHWRYGNVGYQVNFDNQGKFVFPKVIYDFGQFYRNGTHDMYVRPEGGGIVEVLRYATATVVRDGNIVMHMSPGNSPGPNVNDRFPDPLGARYYILGAATI